MSEQGRESPGEIGRWGPSEPRLRGPMPPPGPHHTSTSITKHKDKTLKEFWVTQGCRSEHRHLWMLALCRHEDPTTGLRAHLGSGVNRASCSSSSPVWACDLPPPPPSWGSSPGVWGLVLGSRMGAEVDPSAPTPQCQPASRLWPATAEKTAFLLQVLI